MPLSLRSVDYDGSVAHTPYKNFHDAVFGGLDEWLRKQGA